MIHAKGKIRSHEAFKGGQLLIHILAAGSGKTVLISSVIDEISQWTGENCPLAFFYFSFSADIDLRRVKCSILVQIAKELASKQPKRGRLFTIPTAMEQLYRKYHPSTWPSIEDLDDALEQMLSTTKCAYFVFDALDEIPQAHRPEILKFLADLVSLGKNTRVLVSSRPELDITAFPGPSIHKNVVPFDFCKISHDISSHLASRMSDDPFQDWDESLRQLVTTCLAGGADGNFRWVDLHLKDLAGMEREKDVREALGKLPKGLEATYQRMLERISHGPYGAEAVTILQWLACSFTSLTVEEITDLAAFESKIGTEEPLHPDRVVFNPEGRFKTANKLRQVLSGLVHFPRHSGYVFFDHSSVKEYLGSISVTPKRFRLQVRSCHWFVFQCCLAYIEHCSIRDAAHMTRRPLYPATLLPYACWNVWFHAAQSVQECEDHLAKAVSIQEINRIAGEISEDSGNALKWSIDLTRIQLADQDLGAFVLKDAMHAAIGLMSADSPFWQIKHVLGPLCLREFQTQGIHFAAAAAEPELLGLLLNAGFTYPQQIGPFNTSSMRHRFSPLHATIAGVNLLATNFTNFPRNADLQSRLGQRLDAMKLLFQFGFSSNELDQHGQGLLHYAAKYRQKELADSLLLEAGIDVGLQDNDGRTPLHAAEASEVTATLLRDKRTVPTVADLLGRTPLIEAAITGNLGIAKELIADTRVEINARCIMGRTALLWSISQGHGDVFNALLADPQVKIELVDNESRGPLSLAAERGQDQIIMALLQRTNEAINQRDCFGWTPLFWSIIRGHFTTFSLLLSQPGIEYNIRDLNGVSPLLLATLKARETFVSRFLLIEDLDFNLPDKHGRTPLYTAERISHASIANMLVSKGGQTSSHIDMSLLERSRPELVLEHLGFNDQAEEIWGIEFSHDGRQVSLNGRSSTVQIWNIKLAKVVSTLAAASRSSSVGSTSWSPDDSMIITCGRDCSLKLWDVNVSHFVFQFDSYFMKLLTSSIPAAYLPQGNWAV